MPPGGPLCESDESLGSCHLGAEADAHVFPSECSERGALSVARAAPRPCSGVSALESWPALNCRNGPSACTELRLITTPPFSQHRAKKAAAGALETRCPPCNVRTALRTGVQWFVHRAEKRISFADDISE